MDRYQTTFQTWNKVAATYQEIFMYLDLYNDTYDTFCELIPKPGAGIFEIGCGPGNITRYLLARRPDFKIQAIDVAPEMIALAQKNNPTADFRVMDCREIDTITTHFDGIMCGFCLPYLSQPDCAKLIRDCAALLQPGGIFYISTIEGDYERSGYQSGSNPQDKMYVYYYPEAWVQDQLKSNQFEVVNLTRKSYPKKDGTTDTHLIFIARKSEAPATNR